MNDFLAKKKQLLALLRDNITALQKANGVLSYSQERCQNLLAKAAPTDSELESCEALTARFARAADLITQKVLPNIFAVMQESPQSFIDKCNLAEKFGIVSDSLMLQMIRSLRNEIAHEYTNRSLSELFSKVSENAEKLSTIIGQVGDFSTQLLNDNAGIK